MGKEFDLREQSLTYSCGPGSLVMAYQGHEFSITEDKIIADMGLTDDGASWYQMKMHVDQSGFEYAFKRRAKYEDLYGLTYPIVCYMTYRSGKPDFHFSVVYQIDDVSITLADPSFGDTITYKRDTFIKDWHDEEGRSTFLAITGSASGK